MSLLSSFPDGFRAVVWGASGGLGQAFAEILSQDQRCAELVTISRNPTGVGRSLSYDPSDEASIHDAATKAADGRPLHLVLVAAGTLHTASHQPEKALRQLHAPAFEEVMRINALLPALIAQASLAHLDRQRAVFAALSARVGSISDNRLGGWHSYRASKAALNMLLKNIAIEVARKNKAAVIAGLHPGTVDTGLSEPFQANVPDGKLFTPQHAATQLLSVVDALAGAQSGRVFDYAGQEVPS